MFLGPQYGRITKFSKSTSTMGGIALYMWLNLQLLEGQKPSKTIEFGVAKDLTTTQGCFPNKPHTD
jgi:hypothetical protein